MKRLAFDAAALQNNEVFTLAAKLGASGAFEMLLFVPTGEDSLYAHRVPWRWAAQHPYASPDHLSALLRDLKVDGFWSPSARVIELVRSASVSCCLVGVEPFNITHRVIATTEFMQWGLSVA